MTFESEHSSLKQVREPVQQAQPVPASAPAPIIPADFSGVIYYNCTFINIYISCISFGVYNNSI